MSYDMDRSQATTDDEYPGEKRLAEYIHHALGLGPDTTISIYSFRDQDGGVRIQEISTTTRKDEGIFGSSWMAADLNCDNVIFRAERFLVEHKEPIIEHDWPGDDGTPAYTDFAQEAEQHLYYAINKTFPDWEDRRERPKTLVTTGAQT